MDLESLIHYWFVLEVSPTHLVKLINVFANNVMKDIGHNNSENSTWLNLFICGQFDTLISSHTHIFHQISRWVEPTNSINPSIRRSFSDWAQFPDVLPSAKSCGTLLSAEGSLWCFWIESWKPGFSSWIFNCFLRCAFSHVFTRPERFSLFQESFGR